MKGGIDIELDGYLQKLKVLLSSHASVNLLLATPPPKERGEKEKKDANIKKGIHLSLASYC